VTNKKAMLIDEFAADKSDVGMVNLYKSNSLKIIIVKILLND